MPTFTTPHTLGPADMRYLNAAPELMATCKQVAHWLELNEQQDRARQLRAAMLQADQSCPVCSDGEMVEHTGYTSTDEGTARVCWSACNRCNWQPTWR